MSQQELLTRSRIVQNQRDAFIASQPGKTKQPAASCFEVREVFIAQEIQRRAQTRPPSLVPTGFAAGMAPAIANPTPNAMRATPRSPFSIRSIIDFNRGRGRMLVEISAVVGDLEITRGRLFG